MQPQEHNPQIARLGQNFLRSNAFRRLEEAVSAMPKENKTARGPVPTPPGATRDPKRPGITIAPRTKKRRAARAARRANR